MHFMDMKRHILFCFFISMLMDREKEWGSYKIEIVIKKGERLLLRKLIFKKEWLRKNEIINLKIRWLFLKLSGIVHRRPYKGFQEIPGIWVPNTHHSN
jgi:hypothetical protein